MDFELFRQNPKFICGYSDISALQNAMYAQSGLVTYSGPHFSTFGCLHGIEYVMESFRRAIFGSAPSIIEASSEWSDDEWWLDQEARTFISNEGCWPIREGKAEGTAIGGNLGTLCLLCGTDYMPKLENAILFLEDDYESHAGTFDRQLQMLTMQPGFDEVQALVIGRFQKASRVSRGLLEQIVLPKAPSIPIIGNANFGHTMPFFTWPVGGRVEIRVSARRSHISF